MEIGQKVKAFEGEYTGYYGVIVAVYFHENGDYATVTHKESFAGFSIPVKELVLCD